jgi:ribokinase
MSIVVVGSLNIDRFSTVARLPQPGETVTARETFMRFGGKGANQAVAAARLGARVAMMGAVGADNDGRAYQRRLVEEKIDGRGLMEKGEGVATGAATIAVDDRGENFIIVDPGANGRLTATDVRRFGELIRAAKVVLLQLEIPLEAVLEVLRIAHDSGAAVVFNPSPWRADFPWRDVALHTVIVNETEAEAWLGGPRFPRDLRIERIVVTRGAGPTQGLTAGEILSATPPGLQPVDTVGAGDAFAGAYAVALAEGMAFADALRFANAAGALATQKPGAQEAMPDRTAVEKLSR